MFNSGDKVTHWSDAHDVMTVVNSRPARTQVVCDDGVDISFLTSDLILSVPIIPEPIFTLYVKYKNESKEIKITSKNATGSVSQVMAFVDEHREIMKYLGGGIDWMDIRATVQ